MNIAIVSYLANAPFNIYSSNAHGDLAALGKHLDAFSVPTKKSFLNQEFLKDRALNYGDGCFTSIYAHSQSIFLLDSHLARIDRDCEKLSIAVCTNTIKQWLLIAISRMLSNDVDAYAIKIVVSRGVGGRGYELPQNAETSVFISFSQCARVTLCKDRDDEYTFTIQQASMRLSSQPLLAGIKHLNRLEQILAKRELQQCRSQDLVLCDACGYMIEATSANIFYQKEGTWFTPFVSTSGVDGVMRNAVLDYFANHGIAFEINSSSYETLRHADAVFLCNAIKFLIPVSAVMFNDSVYNIATRNTQVLADEVFTWISKQHRYKVDI